MKKYLLLLSLILLAIGGLWAQEAAVVYYVVPLEKGGQAVQSQDFSKLVYYPFLTANKAKKILYFQNPMDDKIKAYKPKKDDMGMDYIPIYLDDSSKKALFYVNPMDRKITSPAPKKDDMGMDYIPVYEMKVFTK